ncbi:MAG TPA: hypothetical protein VM871_04555, partial [Flavisolibacter sp.]|nr:hypothetical protein [Flavisolibacter sp.]
EAEAYLSYELQSEGLGERFLSEAEAALQKVAENPTYYTYIDKTATIRDVALVKFPFVILFEVKTDRIEVYHIHHTKKELK